MCKKRVTAMRIGPRTYKEIMNRKSVCMHNAAYRSMLVSLKPGCYVETDDGRCGNVVEVKRDHYDIPISVKAVAGVYDPDTEEQTGEHAEWIDVDHITFWEAWDFIAPKYLFEDDNYVVGELMFESEVT